MGIPAFYGWLSQRYRRITRRTLEDTVDNLYVDVNGLIHQACQEERGVYLHDEDEMLLRLVACLDRLLALTSVANLVFLAVDGVAPRAKLNQQRGRRFGSAKARAQEAEEAECEGDVFAFDDDTDAVPSPADVAAAQGELEDVAKGLKRGIYGGDEGAADDLLAGLAAAADGEESPDDAGVAGLGLFGGFGEDEGEDADGTGAVEDAAASGGASPSAPAAAPLRWDSNAITPGTAFMERVADTLREWAAAKAEERGLTVVVSDSNTPGEGEHKFIDFVKAEKAWWQARGGGAGGWFDPNASHAVVSLDADIVLLSLSLHLPRVYVVREDRKYPPLTKFEYCSIDILRECLAEELVGKAAKYADHFASEAAAKQKLSEHQQVINDRRRQAYLNALDFERLLDDFIYMLSLCGNDFVPHLPSAYLGQNAGDTLIDVYARTVGCTVFEASESASHPAPAPYLTGNAGNDLSNLLKLLENYGTLEDALFRGESAFQKQIPHNFYGTHDGVWRDAYYGSVRKMMGVAAETDGGEPLQTFVNGMCRAWVEAVVWVGEYYGRPDTASWSWFYEYYHAPFASDVAAYLRGLRDGDEVGGGSGGLKVAPSELFPLDAPLQPKQQLLSVLPAASFHLLPDGYASAFYEAHRAEYPASWPFDLTGCRAEYHGVSVLPFLDAVALRAATDARTPHENIAGHLVYRAAAKERVQPLTFAGHDLGRGGGSAARTVTARAAAPADVSARYGAWGAASRHSEVRAVDRPCYVPWKLAAAAAAAGGLQGALRRAAAAVRALCDALGVVFLVAAGVWAAARRLRQRGRRSLLGEVAMVALAAGLAQVMRREVARRRGVAAVPAGPPRARKWEKQKDSRKVSALEFFKPKRVRTDWVCRACKCCNWERQTSCFNESCKAVRLVTCPVVYLPKGNVWSPTCYTADHLPQSTTR